MDWLKQLAPTLATALAGPLAGMAVETLGNAFGMPDATKESVKTLLQSATLTADQVAAIKTADADLAIKLQQLGIDLEKVHAGDRDSARKMAAATGDVWTPRIIAGIVFLVWGLVQYVVFTSVIPDNMRELVARMLGTLDAVLMAVVYYYFGSSSGSAAKTQAMVNK